MSLDHEKAFRSVCPELLAGAMLLYPDHISIKRAELAWWGYEVIGIAPLFRHLCANGMIQLDDYTNHGMSARFKAAAMGVEFIQVRDHGGADMELVNRGMMVESPFTGKNSYLVPACYPDLGFIFESGPLSPVLEMGMPLSVGDTRACRKACYLKGLSSVFELTQRGHADYAFIGGAQIDQYGNVNSTFEGGTYFKAQTRFPGSGGAGAMAANCEKSIIIMALEPRRFVNKLDFVTSIGYGDGAPDYREKAGVMGEGPYRVITNEALFGFDKKTRKMMLLETGPGRTAEDIQKKVSFELLISPDLKEMKEPSEEDLRLLREECDPDGCFLARKLK